MESNCLLMKIHRFYLVLLPYSANNSDTDDYHPNTTKSTKNNTFKHYHQAKKPQNIIYSSCLAFDIYKSIKNQLFVPSLSNY